MTNTVSELQVVVSAETAEAERGLKSISQKVESFGDSFKAGLGMGAGIAAFQTGLGAIGSSLGALKGSVIDFNQQLDQGRAIFTRYFEGNQQLAESFLNTLKGFAATTPFEFKDLQGLAIRLQNANTSANDIIPTIKAIGNAASSAGSLSQESIGRITTALTQMQMRGKVSAEEMMQLTEAGVPAWNILADATGKPIPMLMKMASQGEITADVFIGAFRRMYENAGLMEGASKSLEGALSTIRDVGTQAFADIGRSVYDLATQGANALAGFLSGQEFQTWTSAARIGVDALVDGIRSLLTSLQPVGEVIATAFRQFTSGDFGAAFATVATSMQNAIGGVIEAVQAFGQRMFGAGVNLVNELAGGMVDGAGRALTAAVDTVASTIAAFLIGQSPPPDGPLARIKEGGANTIVAWGEGAASAADRAVRPAAEAIAGNLAELKVAGRDVDASIRDLGHSIRDVESASRDVRYAADDIKRAYDDQISLIDDQLKALQKVSDTQRDREKLELNLEEIQLRQAEIAAMGDRELRAQIQGRLESLKASTAERKNREAIADAEQALAGSEKDRLKAKLEGQRLDQQERDLRSKLKDAKGDDKKRIQAQLQELGIRRQIDAAEGKEREEAARRRVADAEAKRGELTLQSQLNALVDQEALASIKSRRDTLGLRKEELTLQEQSERISREIAIAPLKEQRDALVAQRDAMLKPLQEQLETLNRQKAVLGEQRQELQGYKAEISAATQAWKDQESAIKAAAKATKEEALNKPLPGLDKTFTPDAAADAAIKRAKEAGERLATGLRDGFGSMFDRLIPQSIQDALGGISQRLATDGVPVLIQTIGNGLAAAVPVFASKLAGWYGVFLDWARENQSRLLARLSELQGAIRDWIGANARAIGDQLYAWTLGFVRWATETGPVLLDKLADLASDVLKWIGDEAREVAVRLLEWATAFTAWVSPKIPELLTELGRLGARMVEWMGEHLGDLLDALGKWAVEFTAWVGPKIGPLLEELGKLLVRLTEWIVGTALPAIGTKLLEWGKAIVDWVGPRIGPLLEELGKVLLAIGGWIINTALPAIAGKLVEWGSAFLGWVAKDVLPTLPEKLGAIVVAIGRWALDTQAKISAEAATVGAAMLSGIQTGLSDNWGRLKDWITENIGRKLPEWMQTLLGIHSPSTVFADMGRNLILGLIAGMESKSGDLLASARSLFDFRSAVNGPGMAMINEIGGIAAKIGGTDFARAAMAISASETGGGKFLSEIGGTGAQGPFQFDPGGELRNFAKYLKVSVAEAGAIARAQPMLAAQWALEGYLGDALRSGISKGLTGAALAVYGSRVGQRPREGLEEEAGNWFRRLFPGYAQGGWAGLHGPELAWLGERGPEYVVPNHMLGGGGGEQTIRIQVPDLFGRIAEEIVVQGYVRAVKRRRLRPGIGAT